MSLIIEKTGLKLGDGLYFEPGLGGEGLTILQEEFNSAVLGGAGTLSAVAVIISAASARLSGAGNVNAQNT